MRSWSLIIAVGAASTLVGSPVLAQDEAPLSSFEVATACAAPVSDTKSPHALRVIGAQDLSPRSAYDNLDLLVINGGMEAGVEVGARFFVRHTQQFGGGQLYSAPVEIITDGWIRILSTNHTTAVARVERACGPIFQDDYLEPYLAPEVPAESADAGKPDFRSPARIVGGTDGHDTIVPGEFVIIDQGSEQNVHAGARVAIYRDTVNTGRMLSASHGMPLAPIGEAIIVSTSGTQARARIVQARDAVLKGDYAVFRR